MLNRRQIDAYEAVRKGDVWNIPSGIRVRCDGFEYSGKAGADVGSYWLRISRWDGAAWVSDPMLYEDETAVNAVGFGK